MQRTIPLAALCACHVLFLAATAGAEPRETFLGQTAQQWAGGLESDSPSARHLAAWSLAQIGPAAQASLTGALSHDDPTVRYWGVIGLAKTAAAPSPNSPPAKQHLQPLVPLLKDKSAAVRIAAAAALARSRASDAALSALTAALADPQEAVRIQAIDSLERLGPLSQDARRDIERATGDDSEYVKRISSRLLRTFSP